MRKPVVDYRQLRPGNITEPRYRHLLLLLSWVFYFAMYFITERFIPAEGCYTVHCALDDMIPFHEAFIIPYVLWYLLVAGTLLYYALYDTGSFCKVQVYIIITQICAMAIYIAFPNKQMLRPEVFPRDNFLTDCLMLLYAFDTNTNVCPSLHVAYSMGIASVWLRDRNASKLWKAFIVAFVALVCLSTMFIKQHSAVDFFAALPICLFAEYMVFIRPGRKKRVYTENP